MAFNERGQNWDVAQGCHSEEACQPEDQDVWQEQGCSRA